MKSPCVLWMAEKAMYYNETALNKSKLRRQVLLEKGEGIGGVSLGGEDVLDVDSCFVHRPVHHSWPDSINIHNGSMLHPCRLIHRVDDRGYAGVTSGPIALCECDEDRTKRGTTLTGFSLTSSSSYHILAQPQFHRPITKGTSYCACKCA